MLLVRFAQPPFWDDFCFFFVDLLRGLVLRGRVRGGARGEDDSAAQGECGRCDGDGEQAGQTPVGGGAW